MRVIRGTYRGAAEWRDQRRAVQEAASRADGAAPALEPAVVVSRPDEQGEGVGVLVEAVGPDGVALYRRLIPMDTAQPEDALEAAIQEAWAAVGPTGGATG